MRKQYKAKAEASAKKRERSKAAATQARWKANAQAGREKWPSARAAEQVRSGASSFGVCHASRAAGDGSEQARARRRPAGPHQVRHSLWFCANMQTYGPNLLLCGGPQVGWDPLLQHSVHLTEYCY